MNRKIVNHLSAVFSIRKFINKVKNELGLMYLGLPQRGAGRGPSLGARPEMWGVMNIPHSIGLLFIVLYKHISIGFFKLKLKSYGGSYYQPGHNTFTHIIAVFADECNKNFKWDCSHQKKKFFV